MVSGAPGGASFVRDLSAGWREFTSHTWLWVMVAGVSMFLFAIEGPIQVLGPIVARDVYDGAQHGFGGIAGPARYPGSGPDDARQVAVVRSASLAWWDAYLRDDAAARAWLAGDDLVRAAEVGVAVERR